MIKRFRKKDRPVQTTLQTPCCIVLEPPKVLTPAIWGVGLVASVSAQQYAVTFVGVNLPPLVNLPDFTHFVGTLRRADGISNSVRLILSSCDPDTWCATKTTTGLGPDDTLTIRAYNQGEDIFGPVLLSGRVHKCFVG